MSSKRMINRAVISGAKFLKLPESTQNLYFHLCVNADDDGIVEAYTIINQTKSHEDELKLLVEKGYLILLDEDLVAFIVHWLEHNKLREDRKKDSRHQKLLLEKVPDVELRASKERSDLKGNSKKKASNKGGKATKTSKKNLDSPRTAQCSVVESSIDKDNIDKNSELDVDEVMYELRNETLTIADYNTLNNIYEAKILDKCITKILNKPYYNCLNVETIDKWCDGMVEDDIGQVKPRTINTFVERNDYDIDKINKMIMNAS